LQNAQDVQTHTFYALAIKSLTSSNSRITSGIGKEKKKKWHKMWTAPEVKLI
jgi:hypothetical protein